MWIPDIVVNLPICDYTIWHFLTWLQLNGDNSSQTKTILKQLTFLFVFYFNTMLGNVKDASYFKN